jgi:hypothetical protein
MTQTGRSPLLEQNAVGVLVRGTELAGVLVLPDGIDAPESNVFVDSRLSTWQKPRVKRI